MKLKDAPLKDLKIIQLDQFHDERGFFNERFSKAQFAEWGLPTQWEQDNHSRSKPGVLRGLHYQHSPAQGKLVGVIRGRVWDVVVDLRANSPTYTQHFGIELSDQNALLLWVPKGFAHGFCVIGDEPADVFYKVDGLYAPQSEGGIHFADPSLNIQWPIQNPVINAKDQKLASLEEYKKNPHF